MADKLNEAEEAHETFSPGKSYFQDSALGRYLSLLLYRNEFKWDDVRIDLEKIDQGWKLQPDIYTFSQPDLSISKKKIRPPKARLNLIAFTGRVPEKKADTFYIHTEENIIVLGSTSENYLGKQNLSGLHIIPWPGIKEGFHFKVQLPRIEKDDSEVDYIEAVINGRRAEKFQPIESLENAAVETFSVKKPIIFLKTITRSVTKGLAAEQAKQKMTANMESGMAFFTRLAADLLIDTTENADLRSSRFFPATAAIREIHLDEGTYDITINYRKASGTLIYSEKFPEQIIKADRLNMIESSYLN